ncbi:MAG: zinc-binding dehydrogenase [Vampirovibrionales bacterium]
MMPSHQPTTPSTHGKLVVAHTSTHTETTPHLSSEKTFKWISEVLSPPREDSSLKDNTLKMDVIGCSICGSDLEKLRYRECPEGTVLGHELVVKSSTPLTVRNITYPAGQHFAMAHHVPCGVCHQCLSGAESMCHSFKKSNVYPGGFASSVWVSQAHLDHVMFAVPEGFPEAWASCVEPLGCVVRGVQRGMALLPTGMPQNIHQGLGHKPVALVIGLGFIGLLACQVYQAYGFDVVAVEPLASRRALVEASGWVVKAYAPEALETLPAWLHTQGYFSAVDQAFFTVMRESVWQSVLPVLKQGATGIVFASALGDTQTEGFIDPSVLYFREISLISTYSPSLASLEEAAHLLWSGKVTLKGILTHELPMQEGAKGLALYTAHEAIKVFLKVDPSIHLTHEEHRHGIN